MKIKTDKWLLFTYTETIQQTFTNSKLLLGTRGKGVKYIPSVRNAPTKHSAFSEKTHIKKFRTSEMK